MRRLREPDNATPAKTRRGVMPPVSVRAKLGREVLAGEQVRPRVHLEELPHRAGSLVHLDHGARGAARMGHVEVEDHFGAAREENSRGIVVKGRRATRRGVVWSWRCSRGRAEGGGPEGGAGPAKGGCSRARRGAGRTARPLTAKGECRRGEEAGGASFSASLAPEAEAIAPSVPSG